MSDISTDVRCEVRLQHRPRKPDLLGHAHRAARRLPGRCRPAVVAHVRRGRGERLREVLPHHRVRRRRAAAVQQHRLRRRYHQHQLQRRRDRRPRISAVQRGRLRGLAGPDVGPDPVPAHRGLGRGLGARRRDPDRPEQGVGVLGVGHQPPCTPRGDVLANLQPRRLRKRHRQYQRQRERLSERRQRRAAELADELHVRRDRGGGWAVPVSECAGRVRAAGSPPAHRGPEESGQETALLWVASALTTSVY